MIYENVLVLQSYQPYCSCSLDLQVLQLWSSSVRFKSFQTAFGGDLAGFFFWSIKRSVDFRHFKANANSCSMGYFSGKWPTGILSLMQHLQEMFTRIWLTSCFAACLPVSFLLWWCESNSAKNCPQIQKKKKIL